MMMIMIIIRIIMIMIRRMRDCVKKDVSGGKRCGTLR